MILQDLSQFLLESGFDGVEVAGLSIGSPEGNQRLVSGILLTFHSVATEQQMDAAAVIVGNHLPSIDWYREQALSRISAGEQAARSAGINVGGIVLAARESDVNAFHQVFSLISGGLIGMQTDGASSVQISDYLVQQTSILDAARVEHQVTYQWILGNLTVFGATVKSQIWDHRVALEAQIAAATTIEELLAVQW